MAPTETMLALKDVPKFLEKKNGRRLNLCTVYRWLDRGIGGITLESQYCGGLQCTSVEALQRFDERVTAVKCGPRAVKPATPKAAGRAHQKALAKLSA